MKTALVVLAVAISSTAVTHARAQVAWSAIASSCTLMTNGETLANLDAVFGTVNFAAGKAGDFKLTCPIHALPEGAAVPNDLAITFYDDNDFIEGRNHCFISADLLRSNLNNIEHGGDADTISTVNYPASGRSNLNRLLMEKLDFSTSYYWVDVQLHRDSPTARCNPVFVGLYLDTFPPAAKRGS